MGELATTVEFIAVVCNGFACKGGESSCSRKPFKTPSPSGVKEF